MLGTRSAPVTITNRRSNTHLRSHPAKRPSFVVEALTSWIERDHLLGRQVLKVVLAAETLAPDRFESLAYFTSIGPTLDGRIKPDIVAPGTTVSAHP